jgi:hypothetical protein
MKHNLAGHNSNVNTTWHVTISHQTQVPHSTFALTCCHTSALPLQGTESTHQLSALQPCLAGAQMASAIRALHSPHIDWPKL